jgi:large subunit ribosomal protein L17
MSSHRRRVRKFNRDSKSRLALIRGLMASLVEHGRIKTTVVKAKEAKRHIERLITLGKKGDVAARRLILSRIANPEATAAIVGDLAKRFESRPGGYTRVIKIGRRPGDTAEMAFLEFVDFDWKQKDEKAKGDQETKAGDKKALAKVKKSTARLVASKKKSAVKAQKKARLAARA